MPFVKNFVNYIATQGEPFLIQFLDRAFGKRKVDVFKVADGLGVNPAGTVEVGQGGLGAVIGSTAAGTTTLQGTIVSPKTLLGAANFLIVSQDGKNGAGALTLTGAKVGDKVLNVTQVTATSADVTSSFEATITVANQIQQSSATDLSAKVCTFYILHQS